jgi:transposase
MQKKQVPSQYKQYVGIDVSLKSLSVAWGRSGETIGKAQSFGQTPTGYRALVKALRASGCKGHQTVVVLEATSTYWMQVAVFLCEADYEVRVVNPKQAHHFMQAQMQQTKTDAIDAQLLARMASQQALVAWQPPSTVWEAVYQRLVERDQAAQQQQMVRNELHALQRRVQPDPAVLARFQTRLADFQRQLAQIDAELKTLLKDSEWADLLRCLCQIKGIGLLGAAWLLVVTNGFTTCDSAEQLASYLGLVPHRNDSGRHKGHKPLGSGGHARARRVLYQGAISAARFNPPIRDHYQSLLARGKPVKVARCAAARKLVHQVFAIVRQHLALQQSAALPLAA